MAGEPSPPSPQAFRALFARSASSREGDEEDEREGGRGKTPRSEPGAAAGPGRREEDEGSPPRGAEGGEEEACGGRSHVSRTPQVEEAAPQASDEGKSRDKRRDPGAGRAGGAEGRAVLRGGRCSGREKLILKSPLSVGELYLRKPVYRLFFVPSRFCRGHRNLLFIYPDCGNPFKCSALTCNVFSYFNQIVVKIPKLHNNCCCLGG